MASLKKFGLKSTKPGPAGLKKAEPTKPGLKKAAKDDSKAVPAEKQPESAPPVVPEVKTEEKLNEKKQAADEKPMDVAVTEAKAEAEKPSPKKPDVPTTEATPSGPQPAVQPAPAVQVATVQSSPLVQQSAPTATKLVVAQGTYDGEPVVEIQAGRSCVQCKEACPGFAVHRWRRRCTACKCRQDDHDLQFGWVDVRDRIGWQASEDASQNADKGVCDAAGAAWAPPGLDANAISSYMESLPEEKRPKLGSAGQRYREYQLINQLPRQDFLEKSCSSLRAHTDKQEFQDFREKRDDQSMDIGQAKVVVDEILCFKCDQAVKAGSVGIFAVKANPDSVWHPQCFTCTKCNELCVDLVHCHRQGKLYCERHFAELNKPRCAGCEELIFCSEYTKAMGDDFHNEHFTCTNCENSLVGHRYILRDEKPHCIKCYEDLFANPCFECKEKIGVDFKDLSYKDMHWHEKCFKCSDCQKSLVDQPFAHKNDKLFCADCHDINFAPRCDGCEGIFKAGMKKYEYRGKQWHEECFCCMVCKKPIGSQSFIPRENDVVCVPCYEEKFAQRCMKCQGVINKGGVTYKEDPWHRECFTCTKCDKQLAGEKFTSKDDKPYCVECYGELFANKCIKCTKPIMGLGGTKFISFEEKYWHSDCFNCYKCSSSLVGRGFLVNGEEVICPPCGR